MRSTASDQASSKGKPSGATNRGRKLPPEVLTDEEVCALIRACSSRAPTGIRNRAIITILYRSGLRIGEALDLAPKDIDLRNGAIRVLHGKGDKARTIGMDPGALAVVERWLDVRARLGINGRSPAFCSLHGTRLSEAYVRRLFPRLAIKAGIEKRVHAHGLRHTHAAQLRAEGVDIGIISKQLGHSSIATTARYLDHIAPQDVIERMRGRAWAI